MPTSTRKQIRDNILSTEQQLDAQIGDLVEDYINLTLREINNPGWALGGGRHHLWSFLKRKTTFATVSGTEDYVMERDVDKIAVLRQTSTDIKLKQVPDEIFFNDIPDPTASGSPRLYRQWEIEGVSTRLASADEVDVVSSSASDGTSFTATVLGYVSGRLISEVYTLNGTTTVNGSNTFDARELFVAKSGVTTGNITFSKDSDASTLVVLGPQETSPRFKVITLYPKPDSAITMYLEYYKTIRELFNDSDVPEFHEKWHYVVRLGALAKCYQHLGKTTDFIAAQGNFAAAVRSMVADDTTNPDYVSYLRRRYIEPVLVLRRDV